MVTKTKTIQINNNRVYLVAEETCNEQSVIVGFLSYWNRNEPKLLNGELVRDKERRPIIYPDAEAALKAAEEAARQKLGG